MSFYHFCINIYIFILCFIQRKSFYFGYNDDDDLTTSADAMPPKKISSIFFYYVASNNRISQIRVCHKNVSQGQYDTDGEGECVATGFRGSSGGINQPVDISSRNIDVNDWIVSVEISLILLYYNRNRN